MGTVRLYAKKRIADFGYAAIPLALMGHLAFYWDKLEASFWMLLGITNIYKSAGHEVLITGKTGDISALELLFILGGFIGSIYVFFLTSKKTRHILTKATIACYFTVFCHLCHFIHKYIVIYQCLYEVERQDNVF